MEILIVLHGCIGLGRQPQHSLWICAHSGPAWLRALLLATSIGRAGTLSLTNAGRFEGCELK